MAVDLDGGGAAAEDPVDGHLAMTDRTGRRFRCALPANGSATGDPAERGADSQARALAARSARAGRRRVPAALQLAREAATLARRPQVAGAGEAPSELLEALDGVCFYRVEDWWTYELCYKKAVRQFHKARALGACGPRRRPPPPNPCPTLCRRPTRRAAAPQEGEATTAEFRLGAYDEAASRPDEVRHDAGAAPAEAAYVSQARAAPGMR